MKRLLSTLVLLTAAGFACAANPVVELQTNRGTIALELDAEKAPISVENFIGYVNSGHYNGTVFHRVIEGFMIQGGGFDADLRQKPTRPAIKNEAANGLKNLTGTVAMARTNVPDSASSQFFINLVDNDGLDRPRPDGHGYAVFGKVIEGMDVVRDIAASPVRRAGMHQHLPTQAVLVERAVLRAPSESN